MISGNVHRKLMTLKDEIVKDLQSSGIAEADAIQIVRDNLVGYRRLVELPSRETALAASPDASRLLNVPERKKKPSDWQSLTELANSRDLNQNMVTTSVNRLRSELVAEITSIMIDGELAEQLVERHLIGTRISEQTNWPSLALSPEAIRIAEDAGLLVKRGRGRQKKDNAK